MFGNLGNMMRQVQEAQKRAEEMKGERIEAQAGGGLVRCVVNGMGELVELQIDGSKIGLAQEDAEVIQDAVLAAFNQAQSQVQEQGTELLKQLTGGLKLPPGLGL